MGSHGAGRDGSGLARPGGCGYGLGTPGSFCFPFSRFYVNSQSSVSSPASNERSKKHAEKMVFKSSNVSFVYFLEALVNSLMRKRL